MRRSVSPGCQYSHQFFLPLPLPRIECVIPFGYPFKVSCGIHSMLYHQVTYSGTLCITHSRYPSGITHFDLGVTVMVILKYANYIVFNFGDIKRIISKETLHKSCHLLFLLCHCSNLGQNVKLMKQFYKEMSFYIVVAKDAYWQLFCLAAMIDCVNPYKIVLICN